MACSSTSAAAETTSSRCTTESATATHDFEVANYWLLDGMGVGKFVKSSTFTVGGYDWCIVFYPDGAKKDHDTHVSVYLFFLSSTGHARAKFSLSLLDKERTVQVITSNLADHTFSRSRHGCGSSKFFEKSDLLQFPDLTNSYFVIRCVLTVIEAPRTVVVRKRKRVAVPETNLQEHLRKMWRDREGADVVTFSVSGELFHAHRSLLAARSPVFKAKLFGPMKEKVAQCITIQGIQPLIFKALLHFIYTDCIPEEDEEHWKEGNTANLQHLLVAADRYGMERLKLMCESRLCESIDAQTAATTLVLAEQHHCGELRQACVEFMASCRMLAAVMATDGFKHLVASCPSLMVEILQSYISQAG